ncbi:2-dehydro-3-deoxygalactonokinase [Bosea sp. LjRoot9]|uniref:2-dehydro-3-deoxygalactonokinase n=1 Tax=Bosea sp. LjRoot9 TaxID=3342341 RepID=UPI003ED0335D
MSPASHLIAIDWGTSSLRAALMDRDGAILDRLQSGDGVMAMLGRDYAERFESLFGPWLDRHPAATVLASGMVGSRQGWREAPYVACPASFEDLARGIAYIEVEGRGRIGLVPGLVSDEAGQAPDVIRGEEVQVFGGLRLNGQASGVFVLPGTHSKWVVVEEGRIARFHTFMTGELYGLLKRHSILGKLMPEDSEPAFAPAAFGAGCKLALSDEAGALLHRLFSVRTTGLFHRFTSEELPSYLSGLLIGEEVREAKALIGDHALSSVQLICREDLARSYRLCLQAAGIDSTWIDDAAFLGLFDIARRNALIA